MSDDRSANEEYIVLIAEIGRKAGIHPQVLRALVKLKYLPRPIQIGELRKMNGVPWRPKAEGYWSSKVPEVLEKISAVIRKPEVLEEIAVRRRRGRPLPTKEAIR